MNRLYALKFSTLLTNADAAKSIELKVFVDIVPLVIAIIIFCFYNHIIYSSFKIIYLPIRTF
jgi:hypothetical protein